MTSLLAKYVSKKFLGESLQNNFGTEVCLMQELVLGRTNSLYRILISNLSPLHD